MQAKTLSLLILLLTPIIFLAGCSSLPFNLTTESDVKPDLNRIEGHMRFLSDDLLEGRDTGSRGHEVASLYIANEFRKYGLEPGGDNGSYLQRIPFRRTTLIQDSPSFTFTSNVPSGEQDKIQQTMSFPEDFLVSPSALAETASVEASLVFVGYGIVADEFGHNDYSDIDVQGKIAVMLTGKPESMNSDVGSHLSSSRQKRQYAAQRGAIGIITIQTPAAEERRPFERFASSTKRPRYSWLGKDGIPGNTQPEILASAFLSMSAATSLFAAANKDLEEVFEQLSENKVPKGYDLPLSVSINYRSKHDNMTSPNVAGVLKGSDPELRNEYVVYTAHSDHLGITFGKSEDSDHINNGALDNASGTAILIETARMFSMQAPPRRSVLFLAVTAEERGLLGADYFAQNPSVDGELVTNVNIDMPLLTFEFGDVIAFGAAHSSIGPLVQTAVNKHNLELTPDPWPHLNLFTRSDHYAFVRQGVPSVFLFTGVKSLTPGIDGSKVLEEFLQTHYHKPSDDMNQPFIWKAALNFTLANYEIGRTVAQQDEKPGWYRDSFFGSTFGKYFVDKRASDG